MYDWHVECVTCMALRWHVLMSGISEEAVLCRNNNQQRGAAG